MTERDAWKTVTENLQIVWDPNLRVAFAHVTPGAHLGAKDGADLVGSVARWTAGSNEPFAVLADGGGGHETDGKYRAALSRYIRKHHETAFVTFFNLGPVLPVVVEMLRVGAGIPIYAFGDETEARTWLRMRGFAL